MSLEIDRLNRIYPGTGNGSPPVHVLKDVSFSTASGSFLTLLGPSGCGKSTLLNLISGLDRGSSGRISIDGRVVYDSSSDVYLEPADRNISMVFQSYAIWPHMTVRENVEFPLKHGNKRAALSAEERAKVVDRALEKVHLSAFGERPAPMLSGGQQQRVSLARALAQKPSIILLDEPLSNLDASLREHMQKEIRSIVSAEGITAVYVTHDQKEALSMSDLIVVLNEGQVEQIGTPQEIYFRPRTRFVAAFMGSPNLVDATIDEVRSDHLVVATPMGPMRVGRNGSYDAPAAGQKLTLVLKQEDLRLVAKDQCGDDDNHFELPLVDQVFMGDRLEVTVRAGDGRLSIHTNGRRPPTSDRVGVACSANDIHYFPAA